jgi:glycosyltransferase involved in cell wall biosynthesis
VRPAQVRGSAIVMVADIDFARPDGTRSHVIEIASGFAAAGRSVELVARGPDPRLPGVRYRRAAGSASGRIRRIVSMNVVGVATVISMRRRTASLYYRFDPGLIGVVVLARLLGYRAVAEVNNLMFGRDYQDQERGIRGRLIDRGKVLAMRVARTVTHEFIAVTGSIGDILVSGYGVPADRVHVIANGVDVDRFRPRDREESAVRVGLDPACQHVLFVGLLASWVDVPTMLEAFAIAAGTRSDARLVVVGDGPEAAAIDRIRDERALGDRVIRVGPVVDRDRVGDYMAAASVCIVAYRPEMLERIGGGSPMKVLEYLAAGRPVIAIASAGLADLLASTGGGIAVRDVEAMAAALGELLDDRSRAEELGRSGRAAAVERYSWEPVIARTLALLDHAP